MNSNDSYVFVVQGDLSKMACDAWLVPGDVNGVGPSWPKHLQTPNPDYGKRRTIVLDVGADRKIPILTNVGGWTGKDTGWYLEGVEEFVKLAASELRKRKKAGKKPTALNRQRFLLAMSLVGTGGGMANSGEVARVLIPRLQELANSERVDIAIVERDPAKVSAVRFVRRRLDLDPWPNQTQLEKHAKSLGTKAREQKLVLFLGAGVSFAAGLPDWEGLLEKLWQSLGGAMNGVRFGEIKGKLDLLDVAGIIRDKLGGQKALGTRVNEILLESQTGYSLAHGLLANLPVGEVVTTNYDQLFEMAVNGACRTVAQLPWDNPQRCDKWLLKLHGCTSKPKTIVLTRDDYMGYRKERDALAGIVQAMLMTKHMLFVGFSFNDPNFHQIMHEVRHVTRGGPTVKEACDSSPESEHKMGTNLTLKDDAWSKELWTSDLEWVSMLDSDAGEDRDKAAARNLEIFLDQVALEATDATEHLLDTTLEASLEAHDKTMKKEFENFLIRIESAGLRDTGVGRRLRELAEEMGYSSGQRSLSPSGADNASGTRSRS